MKSISRPKLKDYFKNGSRPTEDHFSAFIDATINQEDDEIYVDENRNIGIGTLPEDGIKVKVEGGIQVHDLRIGDRKMDKIYWQPSPTAPQDIYYQDGLVSIGSQSASEKLTVDGAIRVGHNLAEEPGTIRWTGSDFEGRKKDHWVSLTREFDDKEHFESLRIDQSLLVGTAQRLAQVHFEGGAFLVNGNVGVTPVSGYGTRMMWIPKKAAFRAGFVQDNSWDDPNIGINSAAFGSSTKARGSGSLAAGNLSVAEGNYSVALGNSTKATNHQTIAIGFGAEASGTNAVAIGSHVRAMGDNSLALGQNTTSSNVGSTATGIETRSSGWGSLSSGQGTIANSLGSLAIGRYNQDTGHESNWNENDPVFMVGDGTNDGNRSNALLLQKKGDLSVKGILKLGSTETHVQEGTIRWTGNDFEGFVGTEWISFTKGHDQGGTYWNFHNSYNSIAYEGGPVGIGTNRPASLLTVANPQGSGPQNGIDRIGNYNLLLRSGETTPGTMVGIALHPGTDVSSGTHAFAAITAKRINNYNAEIGFVTKDGSGAPTQKMVLRSTGELGIGTPSPRERLDVDGAIKIGRSFANEPGTIRWNGSDFEGRTSSDWVSLTSQSLDNGLWKKGPTDGIYPIGAVGIGTTDPKLNLDARGRIGFNFGANKWLTFLNGGSRSQIIFPPSGLDIGRNIDEEYPAKAWLAMLRFNEDGDASFTRKLTIGNIQPTIYPDYHLVVKNGNDANKSGNVLFEGDTFNHRVHHHLRNRSSAFIRGVYTTYETASDANGNQARWQIGINPLQRNMPHGNVPFTISQDGSQPRFTISSSGNVGIGEEMPTGQLHLKQNAYNTWHIKMENENVTQQYPGHGGFVLFQSDDGGGYIKNNFPTGPEIYFSMDNYIGITGRDYAEYFESLDGKGLPVGTTVVLDGDRIRKAKKNEVPFGVVSANSGLVGNNAMEWPHKYLRDEFGILQNESVKEEIMIPKTRKVKKERQKVELQKRTENSEVEEVIKKGKKYVLVKKQKKTTREVEEPVFEEVDLFDDSGKTILGKHKVPVMETYTVEEPVMDSNGQPVMIGSGKFKTIRKAKINPEYDEKQEYVKRESRPEWNCIGLLGQVPVIKGQPVAPSWVKLKDLSSKAELWLIK